MKKMMIMLFMAVAMIAGGQNKPAAIKTSAKQQCIAICQDGTRCSRMTTDSSKLCTQHKYLKSQKPKVLFTGTQGGKYYLNAKGKKVYVKR